MERYQVLTIAYLRNLFGLDKNVSGAYLDLRPITEDQVLVWRGVEIDTTGADAGVVARGTTDVIA